MKDIDAPLPPDLLARRLTEVYDLVGPLYRRAQRSVEQGLTADGLSVGVRAVLALLHRGGPMTVPRMARAQAISRQFVQRMVNEAAAQDLVESVPNPSHRRSSLIRLTDRGRETVTAVLDREHRILREVGGDLTDADVATCLRVLGAMLTALDHVDEG
ncbi:putative marR-family regulatory protein [Streptomyces ambofaciens ATCC 23877]|uniref:MarR family transcriptional regulator n=2 Tax=Streptomyces ambofaciens TaxID=1889 RepID=A0ABM6B7K7_STRAM|nr:MarR family transcriptional regulator [Streptomyces ambofaciens]AKZ59645.1 putative marR-family regulatory protein [Streptomyces ambofaciens ATCC 23877]ANB09892.1 MarR family transcriptional regulator [Streptomyces ambofaciens]CAJ88682.1 putative marR-family regulatory protein [Streptomyces ambofaciens ATCC 23877]